jgi:hypothetical protein
MGSSYPQKVKNWIKILRKIGTPNSAALDALSQGRICTVAEEESGEADPEEEPKEETSHLLETGVYETTVQSSSSSPAADYYKNAFENLLSIMESATRNT